MPVRFSRSSRCSSIIRVSDGRVNLPSARAIAERLGWRFLELTPGDFFSAKEGLIVDRINEIFENLVQLNNTVIFIDEIDDLIERRGIKDWNDMAPCFHEKGHKEVKAFKESFESGL